MALLGVGKGVFGLALRPTFGILEMTSKASYGMGLVCLGRCWPPSCLLFESHMLPLSAPAHSSERSCLYPMRPWRCSGASNVLTVSSSARHAWKKLWRLCREAISGSTLRRVRAPGALADDQNEVRFPCSAELILAHDRVLQATSTTKRCLHNVLTRSLTTCIVRLPTSLTFSG